MNYTVRGLVNICIVIDNFGDIFFDISYKVAYPFNHTKFSYRQIRAAVGTKKPHLFPLSQSPSP